MTRRIAVSAVGLLSLFAVAGHAGPMAGAPAAGSDDAAPGRKVIVPPVPAEAAPRPSPRLDAPKQKELPQIIARYFEGNVGRRLYLQVDKPLYRPGESIWFKAWDMKARALTGTDNAETNVELISPKGAVVMKRRVHAETGSAANDFDLPPEAQGGEYTLRATTGDGHKAERGVFVAAYEPPRMKKKLEFVKKAYGAGDQVTATVEVQRPTGEALGGKPLTAVVTVDGRELPRVKVTTNGEGGALVKFDLPKTLEAGDGLLTILVEDGGVTESISKSIPIVQKKLVLAFFPEGGKMVAGLPARLYFEAKNMIGKPADVEGRLVDDLGNAVATFATYKNGLGRVEFTPATGRQIPRRDLAACHGHRAPRPAARRGEGLRHAHLRRPRRPRAGAAHRRALQREAAGAGRGDGARQRARRGRDRGRQRRAGGDLPRRVRRSAAPRGRGRPHHGVRPRPESVGRAPHVPQPPHTPRGQGRGRPQVVHAARPGGAVDHHPRCLGQAGPGRACGLGGRRHGGLVRGRQERPSHLQAAARAGAAGQGRGAQLLSRPRPRRRAPSRSTC